MSNRTVRYWMDVDLEFVMPSSSDARRAGCACIASSDIKKRLPRKWTCAFGMPMLKDPGYKTLVALKDEKNLRHIGTFISIRYPHNDLNGRIIALSCQQIAPGGIGRSQVVAAGKRVSRSEE